MRRVSSFRSLGETNCGEGGLNMRLGHTSGGGHHRLSKSLRNGKRETFGGGEFIHELEKKIRRRVTSYPA